VFTIFGLLGPASMVVSILVIASLSRRLGAVTRRPPLYRWLFVGATLICLGIVFRLASMDEMGSLRDRGALLYDAPVVAGLLIAVVVTWRYWGWLLYEHDN
jgi:hypothetical protein